MKIIIIFFIFLSSSVFAKEEPIESLTGDIIAVLNHTLSKSIDKKVQLEVDKTTLLFELIKTDEKFDCMTMFSDYTFEKNKKLLSKVEHGTANFKIQYPGIDLRSFSPNLIQLKKGQTRVLIVKGTLNNEEVYFRIEINDKKEALISYVPISDEGNRDTKKILKAIPIFENKGGSDLKSVGYEGDKRLVGVKGSKSLGPSGSKIGWSVKENGGSAQLKIQSDGEPDQITIGLSKDGDKSEEVSTNITTEVAGVTANFGGKTSMEGEAQGNVKLTRKVGAFGLEARSSVKMEQDPTYGGKISLEEDENKILADVTISDEAVKTKIDAQTKISDVKLTAQHTSDLETGKYKVSTGAGVDLTEQQSLKTTLSVDDAARKEVSVDYSYTTKDKKTKFAVVAKAIVVDEEETVVKSKVSVSKSLNEGKDNIKLSVSPTVNGSGEIQKITLESNWDKKVSKDATFGIFAKTSIDSRGEEPQESTLGIKGKIEFGGPSDRMDLLKVYKLYEVKIKNRNGGPYKAAFYQVWYYHCDTKKMKLRIQKPKKKLFGGYDKNSFAESAMPIDSVPEAEYTIPKGVDKTKFCK